MIAEPSDTRAILSAIYEALLAHYGPQHWWPSRSGSGWEIMLGAALTQRTSWTNVERAFDNIAHAWGLEGLALPEMALDADEEELGRLLRPVGHFTSKPRKVRELARFVVEAGGVEALRSSHASTAELRGRLLGVWGVGPETADAILLYALGRPVFVADAYALRLASRWGLLSPGAGYDEIQRFFMDHLPHDAALFNEYHALIVAHGKALCRPRPLCEECPLNRPLPLDVESRRAATWSCSRLYTGKERGTL